MVSMVLALFTVFAGGVNPAQVMVASAKAKSATSMPVQPKPPVPGLHDFAPLSSITVTRTGPPDATFIRAESKRNSPLVGSNKWHGFLQQSGRNIIITLPVDVAVYSVSIQMEQIPQIGVIYPDHVDFEVMENGNWYEADNVPSPIATWNKQDTIETITGKYGYIKAKQLLIHFPVSGWVFARQIHVWGQNASQSTVQTLPQLPPAPQEFGSPMTTAAPRDLGIKNMLLVYNDGTTSMGTWSVSDFLPMVGYRTQQGQFEGRMFDTMLFLPTGKLANTQASWYGFLSELFSPGTQLDALNQAVGQVNSALAATNPSAATYKEKVVIALPYPAYGSPNWGQINGKNISFEPTKYDAGAVKSRTAAINWYLQMLMNAWDGANYSNLQLVGVYWLSERINYRTPDDPQLVRSVSAVSSQYGLPLLWIPFYDAGGIDSWPSYGFNAAWLQPNYIEFGSQKDIQRLKSAEQLATDTGMGIEIEAPWRVASDANVRSLYLNMLTTMEQDGMAGNVSHAYYAGSKVLITAANSSNSAVRQVYNATYQFMQHQ